MVVLDVGLPGMNGIEAARRIRAAAPGTRVMMLTVHEDQAYRDEAAEAGAEAYVAKRSMGRELIPALRRLLGTAALGSSSPGKASRDREGLARATLDSLLTHVAVLGPDGTILETNAAWDQFAAERPSGSSKKGQDYLRGCTLPGAEEQDDPTREVAAGVASVLAGELPSFEVEYPCPDGGEPRWFLLRATPLAERAGAVVAHTDITARVLAESRVRESEGRLRHLLQTTAEGVLVLDAQARATLVNPALARMLGRSPEELLGREPFAFLEEEQAALLRGKLRERREGKADQYDLRLTHPDGTPRWVLVNATPLRDDQGRYAGAMSTLTDITERKRAEGDVSRLASAVEQAAEAIVITDRSGRMEYVNPAFERVTGYDRDEALGQNPRLLRSGRQDRAFYEALWSSITAGETWRGRMVNRRKDGTEYEEECSIAPIVDDRGAITHYVAVKRDVTEEARLATQLRQAQKMEAVGRLAGGVAHDFNNLLTVILGASELLLATLAPGAPERRRVDEIRSAGERAAGLTRQLLGFSRRQIIQPVVLDLNRVVGELEKLLRRLIGEDIDLVASLAPDLHPVRADPGQIEQVLMNLAVNARDAMPRGGKLTLETRNVELDPDYAAGHPSAVPGPHVLLAVSDTGAGIAPEVLPHIFEPFFTTKERGEGTGLGLATVYGIVKQAGGHVWAYSEPGKGAAFKVYLPAATGATQDTSRAPPETATPTGSETVLVTEDEASVRAVVRTMLTRAGYTVLEAAGPAEALRIGREHGGPVHLLLTDVVMPGQGGRELAAEFLGLHPEAKVLYISGYTDNAIVHHGVLDPGTPFLQKPFSPQGLARKVREVLDARGPRNG